VRFRGQFQIILRKIFSITKWTLSKLFSFSERKHKCLFAGGAGFIGSHLAKRLKAEGHCVVVPDWARNEYFIDNEFCNEFQHVDLRTLDNCLKASAGCDWVLSNLIIP
jgi:hypothetical protein